MASIISNKDFLLDSSAEYTFDPFTITAYGYTISHLVSSTDSTAAIPPNSPVTGLGLISTDRFSVDTSELTTYNFYIYGQIDGMIPITYAFSKLATINIVCGSESITQSTYSIIHPVLVPSSIGLPLSYTDFRSWFSSDKSLCPLTSYSAT